MSHDLYILIGVGIASIICQMLAFRLKLPAILPLLVAGVLLGPVSGVLNPDAVFGDLLFPIVSLAVAIILFEGALTLRLKDIGDHGVMVRNLCSVGVLVTFLVMTPISYFALDVSWEIAALFSALITVTGPTVIMPMIRTIRPSDKVANILRWEGIVIDPIGALLAVLVFEFIVSTQDAIAHTLYAFGMTVAVGSLLGIAGGFFIEQALKRAWIPHYLQNVAVLTLMLGIYGASDVLAHESGLLAVTIMGMWLANAKNIDLDEIIEFKETLSVLLISALFILLAARVDLELLTQVGLGAILVLLAVQFIARPINVWISAIGSSVNWREKALLSWIAPRGIVAAAVSSLFALKLSEKGYPGTDVLVSMVFLVIVFTVVLQSLTSKWVAGWLGLIAPKANQLLIFGAAKCSRELARTLKENNFDVLVADPNWEAIKESRMSELNVYYGNPISEHAQLTLDFNKIRHVLIISPYRQLNPLVAQFFEDYLGEHRVFGVNSGQQEHRRSHNFTENFKNLFGLFGDDLSYAKLSSLVNNGWRFKVTGVSDNYSFEDLQNTYQGQCFLLAIIDSENKIDWVVSGKTVVPSSGEKVLCLVKESDEKDHDNAKNDSEASAE
jgi:NhaP-type Na+/H+ or K+/H+ antiporter